MRTILGLAAAAVLATVAVPAPAAADSPWIRVYRVCEGSSADEQIHRCVELHYDTRHYQFRAHGSVLDKAGGNEYNVDVVSVTAEGRTRSDVDGWYGWWADGDTGQSPLWPPPGLSCGPSRMIVYSATVRWQNAATGAIDSDIVKGEDRVCY